MTGLRAVLGTAFSRRAAIPGRRRSGLDILITNGVMAGRTGTEIFVRQLAEGLHARGHRVAIYSPLVGTLGREIRDGGIPVFESIADVPVAPDVIHAHHVGPTLAALAAFPRSPALFVSHSVQSDHDALFPHPQILAHFAVSHFVRTQRSSAAVPASAIAFLPNAVDTGLYRPARPAREHPAKVAIVAKLSEGRALIAETCRARGLSVEEYGAASGNVSTRLEGVFAEADLVFASGRSALEAMACGCPVMLTEGGRTAGLITPANVEALADLNFGTATMPHRLTAERIDEAIRTRDAGEAGALAEWVRGNRSLAGQIERLEQVYRQLVRTGVGEAGPHRAMASLIEMYVPSFASRPWIGLAEDVAPERLRGELAGLRALRQSTPPGSLEDLALLDEGSYRFGRRESGVRWLRGGWHEAEDWGVWSTEEAEIVALVSPAVRTILIRYVVLDPEAEVVFSGQTRAAEEAASTILDIRTFAENRERIAEIGLPDPGPGAPGSRVRRIALVVRVTGAKAPRTVDLGDDERVLGIGLVSLDAWQPRDATPAASGAPPAA